LALIGLAIALAFALLPIGDWISPGSSLSALLIHDALWFLSALVILLWLRRVEQLPLSSIGLRRPGWKTLLWGSVGGVVLLGCFVVSDVLIFPMFHLSGSQAAAERNVILAQPFWARLVLVLRASVVEEILFRGYIIEKVRQLTGSTVLAFVVSVAVFTYAHLSTWGLVHLIPVALGAVVFALLYIWKRDLPANMLAHFIPDGAGFLLG
jgi:membrane protease YdiL (CAAX protease family)